MRFVTPDAARRLAAECANTLSQSLQPDGRFIYRYIVGQPKTNEGYYSSTRHVGAIWYLLEADHALGPIDGVQSAALATAEHMIEHFLMPYAGDEMLTVLDEGFARLGSTGLAINALCRLWDVTLDERYLSLAKRTAAFIVAQQQDTGDFIQIRQYPLGVIHPARDAFSAGQAVLGLMYLYERTSDERLLQAARKAIKFLDTANYGVRTFSHWMLYALDKLYAVAPEPSLVSYAQRIAKRMIEDASYRKLGLSTPIACRAEGLLAFDRLLDKAGIEPGTPERKTVMRHVRQNLSAVMKFKVNAGEFVEGANKPEVRIDFIYHPGRAFLAYALQAEG